MDDENDNGELASRRVEGVCRRCEACSIWSDLFDSGHDMVKCHDDPGAGSCYRPIGRFLLGRIGRWCRCYDVYFMLDIARRASAGEDAGRTTATGERRDG